ncbi:MAG: hypothetical protein V8S96_09520 [Lachnospiraceae bacterium]
MDWDQIYDSMTGNWKFYLAESQENTVIREVKLSEETMFYPEFAFEQNGTEMLMGRKTMDGVKGHYQILPGRISRQETRRMSPSVPWRRTTRHKSLTVQGKHI